jgi:hypothetical protein
MRLEDRVRFSLLNYPSLYRVRGNPRLSRLKVLDHMFVGIGTGYEWHPTGYLAEMEHYEPYGQRTAPEYPPGYFDKKLYSIEVLPKNADPLQAALGDAFYLRRDCSYFGTLHFFVETSLDTAAELDAKYGKNSMNRVLNAKILKEAGIDRPPFVHEAETEYDLSFTNLCDLSPISEMIRGRTTSYHVPDFDLDGIIKPDYIQGCADLAREAITYYGDHNRYKRSFRYPGNSRGMATRTAFKKMADGHVAIMRQFLDKFAGQFS